MGTLLLNSVNAVDSTFTFAVVFILSIVGLVLVGLTEFIEKRLLHWWERSI
jgi:ABC-type nitrate/sulfonate/bicarbonate transport system permease component